MHPAARFALQACASLAMFLVLQSPTVSSQLIAISARGEATLTRLLFACAGLVWFDKFEWPTYSTLISALTVTTFTLPIALIAAYVGRSCWIAHMRRRAIKQLSRPLPPQPDASTLTQSAQYSARHRAWVIEHQGVTIVVSNMLHPEPTDESQIRKEMACAGSTFVPNWFKAGPNSPTINVSSPLVPLFYDGPTFIGQGFRIKTDTGVRLITAHHVYLRVAESLSPTIEFWQGSSRSRYSLASEDTTVKYWKIFYEDPENDVVIIDVESPLALLTSALRPYILTPLNVGSVTNATTLGHMNDQFGYACGRVKRSGPHSLVHLASTDGGSSGGPILCGAADSAKLLGMHIGADLKRQANIGVYLYDMVRILREFEVIGDIGQLRPEGKADIAGSEVRAGSSYRRQFKRARPPKNAATLHINGDQIPVRFNPNDNEIDVYTSDWAMTDDGLPLSVTDPVAYRRSQEKKKKGAGRVDESTTVVEQPLTAQVKESGGGEDTAVDDSFTNRVIPNTADHVADLKGDSALPVVAPQNKRSTNHCSPNPEKLRLALLSATVLSQRASVAPIAQTAISPMRQPSTQILLESDSLSQQSGHKSEIVVASQTTLAPPVMGPPNNAQLSCTPEPTSLWYNHQALLNSFLPLTNSLSPSDISPLAIRALSRITALPTGKRLKRLREETRRLLSQNCDKLAKSS